MNIDAFSIAWKENPEPNKHELDGRIILDTQAATADAYLWDTSNCDEGWFEYNGKLADIEQ